MSLNDNPITEICIISDKARCPPGFGVLTKAYDDVTYEADVWKDGFFALSRIYRYICICKSPPQNAFGCNVVADLALVNDKDIVPAGYVAVEFTSDTREKALRKKMLCIRMVPRDSTVDAVCDVIILAKQKRPPQGYTLAGEIDGMLLCYKYGVIPADFPGTGSTTNSHVYPNLPYPIHPLSHSSSGSNVSTPTRSAPPPPSIQNQATQGTPNRNSWNDNSLLYRQSSISGSVPHSGIDGVPFELNARLKTSQNDGVRLPTIRPITDLDFQYSFDIENSIMYEAWN